MWKEKSKGKEAGGEAGGDFEAAAARVMAPEVPAEVPGAIDGVIPVDRLEIRPEWAEGAARLCFLPAAKLWHPAFALTDEEAAKVAPQIGALMQAVADRYAPALVGRVANRHPELFDAIASLGVLYWQKWRLVSRMRQLEAEEAAAKAAAAREAAAKEAAARESLPMAA